MNKRIKELIRRRLEGKPLTAPPNPKSMSASRQSNLEKIASDKSHPFDQQCDPERCLADLREGKVYTIANVSRMLRCGKDTAILLFRNEPGVVKLRKVYRIPETVLERVLKRIMRGGE
ncbi:MAG: hypothetical protein JST11_23285 [Acidobacteria bacterium]|nr:hypothetical protein [Acidobacteriota bacterium]